MFSALRSRNYRFYWFGQMPSVLAQNMEHVALAWLVLQLTGSPVALGITGLVRTVPHIALTFVGGAVADRMDRKRLLIMAQGTTALLFFGLGALVATDLVQMWEVLVLAALLGSVRAFDAPSRQGLLPLMVSRQDIANAVPLGDFIWQSTRLIGPATAGMLIYLFGIGPTFYVASAGFVIAVGLFAQLRFDAPDRRDTQAGLVRNMLDGIVFIRRNELVAALIGLTFFSSVFGMSYTILMPVFARDILDVGAQGFGLLHTAGAIGSLVGSAGLAAFARSRGKGWRIIIAAAVFGVLIVGFAFSSSYVLSLGLLFLMGIAHQVYMTTINTTLQLTLPDEFRGRVMGVWGLGWGLTPLGGTISGAIAAAAGAPIAIAVGGTLLALTSLLVGAMLPRLRQLE